MTENQISDLVPQLDAEDLTDHVDEENSSIVPPEDVSDHEVGTAPAATKKLNFVHGCDRASSSSSEIKKRRQRGKKKKEKDRDLTRNGARSAKEANHDVYSTSGNPPKIDPALKDRATYEKCEPDVAVLMMSLFDPESPNFHRTMAQRFSVKGGMESLLRELKGMSVSDIQKFADVRFPLSPDEVARIAVKLDEAHVTTVKPEKSTPADDSESSCSSGSGKSVEAPVKKEEEVKSSPPSTPSAPVAPPGTPVSPVVPPLGPLTGRVVVRDDETDVVTELITYHNDDNRPANYQNVKMVDRDIVLQHVTHYRRVSVWALPFLFLFYFLIVGEVFRFFIAGIICTVTTCWRFNHELKVRLPLWISDLIDAVPPELEQCLEFLRDRVLLARIVTSERIVFGQWLEELFLLSDKTVDRAICYNTLRRSIVYWMPDSLYSIVLQDTIEEYAEMREKLNRQALIRPHVPIVQHVETACLSTDTGLERRANSPLYHQRTNWGIWLFISLFLLVGVIAISSLSHSLPVAAGASAPFAQIGEIEFRKLPDSPNASAPTNLQLLDLCLTTLRRSFKVLYDIFLSWPLETLWHLMSGSVQPIIHRLENLNSSWLMNNCTADHLHNFTAAVLTVLSKLRPMENTSIRDGLIRGLTNLNHILDVTSNRSKMSSTVTEYLLNMSLSLKGIYSLIHFDFPVTVTSRLTTLPLRALSVLRLCACVSALCIAICCLTARRLLRFCVRLSVVITICALVLEFIYTFTGAE